MRTVKSRQRIADDDGRPGYPGLLAVEDVEAPSSKKDDGPPPMKDGKKPLMILGMPASPELLAIAAVYFVQGILGLSRLATTFYMKDELSLDPATVTLMLGLGSAPWLVKPIYGFLSDTVPIAGYRRRSYLLLCGVLSAGSWAYLAAFADSTPELVIALVGGNLGAACSDVVVDSIVVERARGQPQSMSGNLQSLCWGSRAVGATLSAYFSGSLVESWGPHPVFAATAVFPLIVSASSLLITEDRTTKTFPGASGLVGRPPAELLGGLPETVRPIWQAFTKREILLPTIFVFLWQATPSAGSAMFFFQTNKLHFTPEFLGRVQLVGSLAQLGGVALYKTLLKDVPLRKMFFWTMILSAGFGLTDLVLITGLNRQIGLDDHLFVLGDSLLLTVLGEVSFMPVLVLATRICPEGVEATLYATLMSVLNAGGFTNQAVGAALTKALGVTSDDFTNLAPLVTICCLSSLAPMPFLSLLPANVADVSGGEADDKVLEADDGRCLED